MFFPTNTNFNTHCYFKDIWKSQKALDHKLSQKNAPNEGRLIFAESKIWLSRKHII